MFPPDESIVHETGYFNDQTIVLLQITLTAGLNLVGKSDYQVLHRRKKVVEEIRVW